MKLRNAAPVALACALVIGCGDGSTKPSTTQSVKASSGATLMAGSAKLTIPPGALTHDTTVTLREVEPHHTGREVRVEVEPHDVLAPNHHALLSVGSSEANARVTMHHGADDSLLDVEVEDRNHHAFKTNSSAFVDVEVEVEHGATCATTCPAGHECHDGVCEEHDHATATCSAVCEVGEECDDGTCKTHDQYETDHHGTPGTCSPTCAAGLTCHDGICSAHN